MQLLYTITAFAACQVVYAHSIFTTLFVNDVNQGDGTCIRMPKTPNNATFPINDLASNDIACGYGGAKGVARVCSITQGAKLGFQWREWADGSKGGAIDTSHKGPCAVYMKAVSSAIDDLGYGFGWFKIWASGYNVDAKQWCTEKLNKDNGLLTINVPNDLLGGYYLVRPELLALHEADKMPSNPQFYTGCAQVFLESTGTGIPSEFVNIPGHVHAGEQSVTFNIYEPNFPYSLPGPAPYISSKNENLDAKVGSTTDKIQREGLIPPDCILMNANWAGIELDSYHTEDGCWNASTHCWNQTTVCYSEAPPTGSKNCRIWEKKCTGINDACETGIFSGPPGKGIDLNPVIKSLPSISEFDGVYSPTSHFPGTSKVKYLLDASRGAPVSAESHSTSGAQTVTSVVDAIDFVSQASKENLFPIPGLLTAQSKFPVTNTFKGTSTSDLSSTILVINTYPTSSILTSTAKVTTTSPAEGIPSTSFNSTLFVSINATCGPIFQTTCQDSVFGSCCSQYGWCGSSPAYCSKGCQEGFGSCGHDIAKLARMKMAKHRHLGH